MFHTFNKGYGAEDMAPTEPDTGRSFTGPQLNRPIGIYKVTPER